MIFHQVGGNAAVAARLHESQRDCGGGPRVNEPAQMARLRHKREHALWSRGTEDVMAKRRCTSEKPMMLQIHVRFQAQRVFAGRQARDERGEGGLESER